MSDEILAGGVVGFLLSSYSLMKLRQKGLLTDDEAKEIADLALLALETYQAKAPAEEQRLFEESRRLLELLLREISPGS